ncbi:hypothetical protein GQ43DRAFT_392796, partial [Delitschia confertaspora ATCC 74209]
MAPPNRSITDFFKPGAASSQPVRDSRIHQSEQTNGQRMWPSPRTNSRVQTSSHRLLTASPTPRKVREPSPVTVRTSAGSPPREYFTSPPDATQTSFGSNSSRRCFKGGQEVVTNSDPETDSSEDDLPSLDFGVITNPSPQPTPIKPSKPTPVREEIRSTRSTLVLGKRKAFQSNLHKQAKPSTASLSFLVADARKDAERARKIAEIKADLEEEIEDAPDIEGHAFDENALVRMMDNDEDGDKVQRLKLAMQRTNAIHLNTVWHSFDEKASRAPVRRIPFPSRALPQGQRWAASFQNSRKRDQAFLSGHAHVVFQYQELPEELVIWMIDQLIHKARDAPNMEYLKILGSHPERIQSILTPQKLDEIFHSLGAKPVLTSSDPVAPSYEPPNTPRKPLPQTLKWVMSLLHQVAPFLPPESRAHALETLLTLSIDDSILADADLSITTQEAVEALLCSIPPPDIPSTLDDLTASLLRRITHPVLQHNLVTSLPTISPLAASLQRQLALSFFLHPTRLDAPLDSPAIPQVVLAHLRNAPIGKITKETDYSSLTASISLLDIGIGPGFTTVPYLPFPTPTPLLQDLFSPSRSTDAPPPATMSLPPLSAQEKAFNAQIDALAKQVKLLSNDIVEAGAMSNLTKLDAKDASERLFYRLESAVRTRGRKRKVLFGGVD